MDCVYNFKLKKYYILDIIEWMGVKYSDFDVCIMVNAYKCYTSISQLEYKKYSQFEIEAHWVGRILVVNNLFQ